MINSFCDNLSMNRVAMYSSILNIKNDTEKFSYAYWGVTSNGTKTSVKPY
jgi:hypothetical protein